MTQVLYRQRRSTSNEDYKALTDPRVKQRIQERGIILTTWKELKERRKKAAVME